MKPYEAVIIFNPSLTEEKIDASMSKFEKKIKDAGGSDITITKWGIKKLQAPFKNAKKITEGFYILVNFNGAGGTPNDLKAILNISEEVIRYSVTLSRPEQERESREEKVEIAPSMIMPQDQQSSVIPGQGEASS